MGTISSLKYHFLVCVVLCVATIVLYHQYITMSNEKTRQQVVSVSELSLDYAKDFTTLAGMQELEFFNFTGDNDPNTKRPLPHPRSHVLTNSSHVIELFARNPGCGKKEKHGINYQYLKIALVCQEMNAPGFFCRTWLWDPANWTLRLFDELETAVSYSGYQICSFPVVTERVHKIIYPNGTVDLPGCSSHRNSCTPVDPYFDKVLDMRINWSPCCRKMNIQMLVDTAAVFERQNVRYVMIGGACISVVRENGTFIPYDTDLDIMVDIRDRGKFRNKTTPVVEALGYYTTWNKKNTYVRICVNAVCDAHIDMWFYVFLPNNRNRLRYHGMHFWEIRESVIFPTSWQYFEGRKYRFPRKILKYLKHEYSSGVMAGYNNWNDVFLCNFKRGRKCTHYPE